MSTSTSTRSSGGISLLGWVFILFLALKLLGKIGWSWWWVTSPLWGPSAVIIAILAITLVLRVILSFVDALSSRKRRKRYARARGI